MSPRSGLNQEIIIQKALKIADQEGVHAVTMATLARELNIKSPSLYNHFNGLPEIRHNMTVKALEFMYQKLVEATWTSEEGEETIRAISKAYIQFANQHPGIYEASLSAPDTSSKAVMDAGDKIVSLTLKALSGFDLSEKGKIHAVRGLRSLLHGMVDLTRKIGFNLEVDLEETQEVMIETFIKGLR